MFINKNFIKKPILIFLISIGFVFDSFGNIYNLLDDARTNTQLGLYISAVFYSVRANSTSALFSDADVKSMIKQMNEEILIVDESEFAPYELMLHKNKFLKKAKEFIPIIDYDSIRNILSLLKVEWAEIHKRLNQIFCNPNNNWNNTDDDDEWKEFIKIVTARKYINSIYKYLIKEAGFG